MVVPVALLLVAAVSEPQGSATGWDALNNALYFLLPRLGRGSD
jgi:hypothetical protein